MSDKTIYEKLKEAGVEVDSHQSDLYAKKTEESERIVKEYEFRNNVTIFRSNIDGELWFDIPFAYDLYWKSRAKEDPI